MREFKLSILQEQIISLVCEGLVNKEVAEVLEIETHKVSDHRSRIYSKLGVRSVPELVRFALRHGLTEL